MFISIFMIVIHNLNNLNFIFIRVIAILSVCPSHFFVTLSNKTKFYSKDWIETSMDTQKGDNPNICSFSVNIFFSDKAAAGDTRAPVALYSSLS